MLLSFGFKNFFSFREGAKVDLTLGRKVPPSISQGRGYSTVACIKGANASGKTNVLKALSFTSKFAIDSFDQRPEASIEVTPFFNSKTPTYFTITFEKSKVKYTYDLNVTRDGVISEKLYRTIGRKTLIADREGDTISCTEEFKVLETMKLRKNASFISLAKQHEFIELKDVYDFFRRIVSNVDHLEMHPNFGTDEQVAELYSKHSDLLEFANEFIRKCDAGITNIEIGERETPSGKTQYFPIFYHGTNNTRPIIGGAESSGTRALFRKISAVAMIILYGGVLVADEVDIHLHPHILERMIKTFLDESLNKHGAQLVFTTHNSDIMNSLGKYRVFLSQKFDNESFIYRLDEIPGDLIRNDRPISTIYDQGRIGGVPRA